MKMQTVIVISDSHGNKADVDKLRPLVAENDYIIHLGDGANDMVDLYREFPDKVYVCNGNCDGWGSRIAGDEWEIEVGNHKIFCCHGHKYRVKSTLEELKREARARGCDIALYGHTHEKRIDEEEGLFVVNPGTMSKYAYKSYCYLVLTDQKVVATLVDC